MQNVQSSHSQYCIINNKYFEKIEDDREIIRILKSEKYRQVKRTESKKTNNDLQNTTYIKIDQHEHHPAAEKTDWNLEG
jgi:hypothetical protein